MRRTLLLATAALLATPPLIGQASAASAPDVGWAKSKVATGAVIDKAAYRCGRWSWRCSKRWGWGSPRYGRCMWRHGC